MALLNVKQTAARLGTTERHVRELLYRRDLAYVKVGRLVRIDSSDLEEWLQERRRPATGTPAA